jgi:teichuronic acid biosynthesis glycosyltransferase TuaG
MYYDSGKVSIITPVYNVRRFIFDTISSVIEQEYSDWELILIDDNSTDGGYEELVAVYGSFEKIKIIRNSTNLGAGFSRNAGMDLADGRYIAFLDSDDIWSRDKLSTQLKFMEEHNAPICHTSFSFIDYKGDAHHGGVKVSEKVDLIGHLKNTEIGTSTAIIDRNLVGDFRFSLIRARQDLKLWISLLASGYISFGLDKDLVKYRVRKGSVSSNKIKMLYVTFFIYIKISQLTLAQRISCYISYLINAISKRRGNN